MRFRGSRQYGRVLATCAAAIPRHIGRKSIALKIQLLGTFRVATNTGMIESAAWRLRKASHIVKILALEPRHRLHRERLLDLLWPDLPPESAANNMRVTLHAARHTLNPENPTTAIALEQDWLTLSPAAPPDTDVARFEEAAVRALRGSDIESLRAAVGLYGGELLPDDPYEEWAIERRAALQASYLRLLLQLGLALEARGQSDEVIATYTQALRADRSLEAAHRGLMRAYAATGQRELARRQFQDARQALRADLDVEPDQETLALLRAIEAGEDVSLPPPGAPLATEPRPARPRPADHAPPGPAEPRTSFVGRQSELAAIGERLASERLLTLTGPGGIGKTRLAQRAAAALQASFDSVYIAELAGVENPELVAEAVATAVNARAPASRPALERINAALTTRRALLVLDNCEHLLDACAQLADHLLRGSPSLRLLATSRQRLGVPGESIVVVPPLGIPRDTSAALTDVDEAVRLFVDRARLYDPQLRVSADNAAALVSICRATDGVPLAIELAAARVPALGLQQLADRLDNALGILRAGPRTVDARHQSLEAALDWSHALLSDDERALFAHLSVFASGWSLEAAEAVSLLGSEAVLDGLFQLVDKSLVLAEEGRAGSVRYRMLEPLRQYAARTLERSPAPDTVRRRHAGWCLQMAERAERELAGAGHQFWLEQLEVEHDNLRAALGWCLEAGEHKSGLRIASSIWRFWEIRGHVAEGRGWLERLLASAAAAPPAVLAAAYNAAGNLAADQGDFAQSDALLEQSLASYRESADTAGVARVLNNLAINASEQGDFARAEARYEESLQLSRELGDQWQIARALNNLGAMSLYSGRYERAAELLAEAHPLWLALGDRSAYAQSLDLAGELARERGELQRAAELHSQSLEIRRELGDQRHVAASLHNLAVAALCAEDHERAAELARAALNMRREVGFQRGVIHSLACLAQAALRAGEVDEAGGLYRESLMLRRELGSHEQLSGSLAGLAAVALARARPAEAAQLLACAATLQDALGAPLPRVDGELFAATLERCRATLDAAEFERCWSRGQALTAGEVILRELAVAED